MARFMLFLFVAVSMTFTSRAEQFQKRSLPDSSLETSKLDEGDQNDWKQMNDEEDLVQYEREEMDGAEEAELANLPGEQVKGYKDDWVTKEALAEDADLDENPAEGSERNKRAVCLRRVYRCRRRCFRICRRGRCYYRCRIYGCRLVCVKYG